MENQTESQKIIYALSKNIKDLMLSGNFKVIGVFLQPPGGIVVYDIDVDGICLSIPISGNNMSFYNFPPDKLMPVFSSEEVKIVIDFILKGGIKCAIDSLKLQIESDKTHLESLLNLYNSK